MADGRFASLLFGVGLAAQMGLEIFERFRQKLFKCGGLIVLSCSHAAFLDSAASSSTTATYCCTIMRRAKPGAASCPLCALTMATRLRFDGVARQWSIRFAVRTN